MFRVKIKYMIAVKERRQSLEVDLGHTGFGIG